MSEVKMDRERLRILSEAGIHDIMESELGQFTTEVRLPQVAVRVTVHDVEWVAAQGIHFIRANEIEASQYDDLLEEVDG